MSKPRPVREGHSRDTLPLGGGCGGGSVQRTGEGFLFSASDLVGHVDCRHLTALDAAVARGHLTRPQFFDASFQALLDRGLAHERHYVEHLRAARREIVEIAGAGVDEARAEKTIETMRAGADVIVQAAFVQGSWSGRADVLLRVEAASDLGRWSYEVVDTKLARRTKGATILQLCLYSDLLSAVQGLIPEHMHVVAPGSNFAPETYRTSDFTAYYRRARRGFEHFLQSLPVRPRDQTYPEPNPHCELCAWRRPCDARRRADDHLCLVAGITKLQITELEGHEIATATALARAPLPLSFKPSRGAVRSYERIREQARIQLEGRVAGRTLYETLPVVPTFGLASLPVPSPGDIFLDLEGDPFAGNGGIEYLFGYLVTEPDGSKTYRAEWALSREAEKQAFENFVDFATARWKDHPDLHIYHYAPYEPSALKRLMGRYATREEEVDRMLHGRLFVDLYQVARHAIRASVESYSIKELESLFGFSRATPLDEAGRALSAVQAFLEFDDEEAITAQLEETVAGYNRDDCLSVQALRQWLENVRSGLVAAGVVIERPLSPAGEVSEALGAWQQRVADLMERLIPDVPVDVRDRTSEQQARWILAHVLDWHRRENKAVWWEYFRLAALPAEDLLHERAALAGLSTLRTVGGTTKAPVHRYRFPAQETELRGGESLRQLGGDEFGAVERISLEERTIDIKKRVDTAGVHPEAVFAHNLVRTDVLAESLLRVGDFVARCGVAGEGRYGVARDLLLRQRPRLGGEPLRLAGESTLSAGMRIARKLKGGVLPIQGPPGTGKTHIGARMICALIQSGAKVGITATSHKAIRRLLDEVGSAARESGVSIRCIQKSDQPEENQPSLVFAKNNEEVFRALRSSCQVAAGTAWLWARPEACDTVDVLFVDEAAQMSLANVLALSHAAPNLVLLGDPRQLEQPIQGSHPEGTSVSALDYILAGHETIAPDQGLFLSETWRLHPEICDFTSELFYERRLQPIPGLEQQEIRSQGRVSGAGLRYLSVEHQGNQSSSPEEARAVRALVADLLESKATWTDREGIERPIGLQDILIIAPYNAQVLELQERIPGARIGTVDKFQGQEAPIVIYSMTTSALADAPRGMNFLYSLNRLNVATSRARALSVLVSSPALFEAECQTPEQMRMANAFCRYLEMARTL
jgi:predicted RecB family nuclease